MHMSTALAVATDGTLMASRSDGSEQPVWILVALFTSKRVGEYLLVLDVV
jgi:hypothetical protein